jgi:hypothetical protein
MRLPQRTQKGETVSPPLEPHHKRLGHDR